MKLRFRTRLSLVLAASVAFSLITGGTTFALWSTTASVTSTVAAANLSDSCQNVTSMVNASFEQPVIAGGQVQQAADGTVPGWRASRNSNGAPLEIEIWRNYSGVASAVGSQHVELNSNAVGTLKQSISTPLAGQTLQWSFWHRGRTGVDTMELRIGAPGAGAAASQGQFSDGLTWVQYSGAYVVPAGQPMTELSFVSVSADGGNDTIGNFLDDVAFGSGPCLTATSTNPVTNITNPGGNYRVGDIVEYRTTVANIGSAPSYSSSYAVTLPSGVSYLPNSLRIDSATKSDAAADDEASYDVTARKVTANLGTMASASSGGLIAQGSSMVVTFQATILAAAAGTTVSFAPSVSYVNGLATSWPLTATATPVTFTPVLNADLAVVAVATPAPVAGSTATWRFSVSNNGPSAATGASVALTLPSALSGATVTRGTTNGGAATTACTGTGTSRTCTIGALPVGESRIIDITFAVPATYSAAVPVSITATASGTTNDDVAGNNSATISSNLPKDSVAPTVPGQPTASGTTASQTTLTWTGSTDTNGSGVAGYDILRDGTVVGSTAAGTLTYTDTGLTPGSPHSYTIRARDNADNASAPSAARAITTTMDFTSSIYTLGSNGRCAGVTSTNLQTDVLMLTCVPTSNLQRWSLIATNTTGAFNIVLANNTTLGWDMEARNNTSTDKIEIYNQPTMGYQRWVPIVTNTNGVVTYQFRNSTTNLCAQLSNTNASSTIVSTTCNAAVTLQQFTLTKVN